MCLCYSIAYASCDQQIINPRFGQLKECHEDPVAFLTATNQVVLAFLFLPIAPFNLNQNTP